MPTEQVETFKSMLKLNGVLIGPVQETETSQTFLKYTHTEAGIKREKLLGVIYTKLQDLEMQTKQ